MSDSVYPPWVVLHIPHDSTRVPQEVRKQFLLSDEELTTEIQLMTDHFTHALFAQRLGEAAVVRAPVSRLVVDVERFADDSQEPMAKIGMGAIYHVTSQLDPLRRNLDPRERDALMREWYFPHHELLENSVDNAIKKYGRCVVVDCHSFPGIALPYENKDSSNRRPDICIGTDSFHTPVVLAQAFLDAFGRNGWRVALNDPFAGALVPSSRYQSDSRVTAVMVEINRDLYLDPTSYHHNSEFNLVASLISSSCISALEESNRWGNPSRC